MKNEIEEPKIGGHYFTQEMLNYLYCFTCLKIVLDKSEKAKELFEKIKKCWGFPGCKQLSDGLANKTQNLEQLALNIIFASKVNPKEDRTLKLKDMKPLISGMRKLVKSYIFQEKVKLFFNRRKWKDYKYLVKSVEDFIVIGFNRESDRARGEFKISVKSSKTLVETVYGLSLIEARKIDLGVFADLVRLPAVTKGKNTSTFEELINDKVPRRLHNQLVDEYQNAGFGLKNEEIIARNAYEWCQCRIFYPTIEAFCNSDIENKFGTESANVNHHIKECDEALGYPRGK